MKVIDYINEHLNEIKDKYNKLIKEEKEEYDNVISEIQEKNKKYPMDYPILVPYKDAHGFLKRCYIHYVITDHNKYYKVKEGEETRIIENRVCLYYKVDKYNEIYSDMENTRSLLKMMLEIKDNTPKMDCISKYDLNKMSKYRKIISYDKTWDWSVSSSSSSEYQSSSSGSLKGGYGRSLFSASGYIKGNSQSQTQYYSSSNSSERGKDDIIIEYQYNLDYDMDLVLLEHPDIFEAIWEIYKGGITND